MNDLTLVIPAKNEAESLPKVLEELQKFNYNISVVLHKTDHQTIKSIENYDVKLVFQENFGYGDALILGMNTCETKYFCIFNADGSFNPNELNMMIKKVETEGFCPKTKPHSNTLLPCNSGNLPMCALSIPLLKQFIILSE